MQVSTDLRKVLAVFTSVTGKEPTIEDIMVGTSLCYSFYAKTITSHINRYYNPESPESDTMLFYVKPTLSINKGRRFKGNWSFQEIQTYRDSFIAISNYVDMDFNHDNLVQLREICKTYLTEEIRASINIAETMDVRTIPYLARVLERYRLDQEKELNKRRRLIEQERKSREGLQPTTPTVQRTPIEIASLMGSWLDEVNTAELERKLDEHDI